MIEKHVFNRSHSMELIEEHLRNELIGIQV